MSTKLFDMRVMGIWVVFPLRVVANNMIYHREANSSEEIMPVSDWKNLPPYRVNNPPSN